jgi:hypothetical protein
MYNFSAKEDQKMKQIKNVETDKLASRKGQSVRDLQVRRIPGDVVEVCAGLPPDSFDAYLCAAGRLG